MRREPPDEGARLSEQFVSGQREKFVELWRFHHEHENLDRADEMAAQVTIGADFVFNFGEFLLEKLIVESGGEDAAVGEFGAGVEPLPELSAGNLGRGCVFHEVVKRDAAKAAEPGFDVLDADA